MSRNRKMMITFTFNGKLDKRIAQHGAGVAPSPCNAKKKRSEKQGDHLSRFEKAKEFGRQVVANPLLTAHYAVYRKKWKRKLKHTGIYQLAIMDFMNSPVIHKALLEKEPESPGNIILINVWQKFEISHVGVSMIAPDGKILETGEIYKHNSFGYYVYALSNAASVKPGVICRISVHDFPGNVTEKDYYFFG
jgi:hypothetical protein